MGTPRGASGEPRVSAMIDSFKFFYYGSKELDLRDLRITYNLNTANAALILHVNKATQVRFLLSDFMDVQGHLESDPRVLRIRTRMRPTWGAEFLQADSDDVRSQYLLFGVNDAHQAKFLQNQLTKCKRYDAVSNMEIGKWLAGRQSGSESARPPPPRRASASASPMTATAMPAIVRSESRSSAAASPALADTATASCPPAQRLGSANRKPLSLRATSKPVTSPHFAKAPLNITIDDDEDDPGQQQQPYANPYAWLEASNETSRAVRVTRGAEAAIRAKLDERTQAEEILRWKESLTITRGDLARLDPGEFLNDSLINFYLKYLEEERFSDALRERVLIFNTFFIERLRRESENDTGNLFAAVRKWSKGVDLLRKEYIVVPINENAHWTVAIICHPWMTAAEVEQETITPPTTANCPVCQLSLASVRGCQDHWVTKHHPELAAALPPVPLTPTATAAATPTATPTAAATAAVIDDPSEPASGPRENGSKSLAASPMAGESPMEADDEGSPASEKHKRKASVDAATPARTPRSRLAVDRTAEPSGPWHEKSLEDSLAGVEALGADGPAASPASDGSGLKAMPAVTASMPVKDAAAAAAAEDSDESAKRRKTEASRAADQPDVIDLECEDDVVASTPQPAQPKSSSWGLASYSRGAYGRRTTRLAARAAAANNTALAVYDTLDFDDELPSMLPTPRTSSAARVRPVTAIIRRRPCVLLFDSLGGRKTSNCNLLRKYINSVREATRPNLPPFDAKTLPQLNVQGPNQDNYSDCGVFLLRYVEQFFNVNAKGERLPPDAPVGLANYAGTTPALRSFPVAEITDMREELKLLITKLASEREAAQEAAEQAALADALLPAPAGLSTNP